MQQCYQRTAVNGAEFPMSQCYGRTDFFGVELFIIKHQICHSRSIKIIPCTVAFLLCYQK